MCKWQLTAWRVRMVLDLVMWVWHHAQCTLQKQIASDGDGEMLSFVTQKWEPSVFLLAPLQGKWKHKHLMQRRYLHRKGQMLALKY